METLLVRLKPHDPRRGHVLRRYTYRGIKFHEERGWYRVEKPVADYLRAVRQVVTDQHSPLAFDVCTDDEAKSLDAREKEAGATRKAATDDIKVSAARTENAVTTEDLPEAAGASGGSKVPDRKGRGK
ncbi:MAG: hypothetical protein M0R76_00295 [Proteobacteria bacterium]|nr:hypothetical protein [Pseudomonadota bacterium]